MNGKERLSRALVESGRRLFSKCRIPDDEKYSFLRVAIALLASLSIQSILDSSTAPWI